MKTQIHEALERLQKLNSAGYIREEGNTEFQHACTTLQSVIDAPDAAPAPAPVIVPAGVIEAIDERLEAIELHLATFAGAQPAVLPVV